jgi:hypothetical protein
MSFKLFGVTLGFPKKSTVNDHKKSDFDLTRLSGNKIRLAFAKFLHHGDRTMPSVQGSGNDQSRSVLIGNQRDQSPSFITGAMKAPEEIRDGTKDNIFLMSGYRAFQDDLIEERSVCSENYESPNLKQCVSEICVQMRINRGVSLRERLMSNRDPRSKPK